jgi:hypothetical protein
VARALRASSARPPFAGWGTSAGRLELIFPHRSKTSAASEKRTITGRLLGSRKDVVIMMVSRNGHAFIPTGRSTLHAHDKLLVFADRERLAATMKIMEAYDPQQIPGPRGDVV